MRGDTNELVREQILMGLLIDGFSPSCCFSSLVSAGIPEKNAQGYHHGVVEYFLHVRSLQGWETPCQNQVEKTRSICSSSGAKAA